MKKNLIMAMSLLVVGLLAGCDNTNSTETPVSSKPGSTSAPVAHVHTWDEGAETKAPKCEKAGEKTFHCTADGCDGTKTEAIPALGHLPGETFSHDGDYHWKECLREGCDGKAAYAKHTFTAGEKDGLLTKETCECGVEAYRLDVADAEGWNNAASKMNGKEAPNNKSSWAVANLPAGTYSVQLSVKLSYDSHGDRYWYNMHETDTASSPDKETEAPFRYFITLDDGDAINPTNIKTWAEDGLNASDFTYVTVIDTMDVTKGTKVLSLNHGDIGYSVAIDHVRLVLIEEAEVVPAEPIELAMADAVDGNKADGAKHDKNAYTAWDISALEAGTYKLSMKVKMTSPSHSDRLWSNMHEADAASGKSSPDKETEAAYRYDFKVDDTVFNITNTKSYGENGMNATEAVAVEMCEIVIPAGAQRLTVTRLNIGYSVYIYGLVLEQI